jgi:hypothetical protein
VVITDTESDRLAPLAPPAPMGYRAAGVTGRRGDPILVVVSLAPVAPTTADDDYDQAERQVVGGLSIHQLCHGRQTQTFTHYGEIPLNTHLISSRRVHLSASSTRCPPLHRRRGRRVQKKRSCTVTNLVFHLGLFESLLATPQPKEWTSPVI